MILVMPQNFRDYWEGGTFSYIPSVQHPLWEFLPRSLEHSPWQAWYYHCSTSANAKVGFNRNPLMCLIMAPGQPPPPLLLLSPIINCRSLVLIQTFSTVFGSASALPTLYFYFIFLFFIYFYFLPQISGQQWGTWIQWHADPLESTVLRFRHKMSKENFAPRTSQFHSPFECVYMKLGRIA